MIEFISAYKIDIAIVVSITVLLFIFRKTLLVKSIMVNALNELESKINTNESQISIDKKVKELRDNKEIPFIIRKCITKHLLITLIEKSMNMVSGTCDIGKEYDLKGNDGEDIKQSTKIDLNSETMSMSHKIESGKPPVEPDTYVYAEVKAKTDFRDRNTAEVSVGIKKKL
ncbi:MAG: hypothetical protein ACRCRT_04540 [Cetobacterium somerae]